jgi:hypothetical protein
MFFGMLLLLFGLGGVVFCAFKSFDGLVSAQYRLHRESWIDDGKVAGFFWCPEESEPDTSRAARLRLTLTWLVSTPAWAAGSPDLLGLLHRLRAAIVVWNVGLVSWLVAFKHLLQR